MTTDKEWTQIWYESKIPIRDIIKQAQADALRHAAMLCANSDNHLCGIAAIENEANKLKTK